MSAQYPRKFDLKKIRENIEKLIDACSLIGREETANVTEEELQFNDELDTKDKSKIRTLGSVSETPAEIKAREDFFDILDTFTHEELVEMLSVMYAGRDYEMLHGSDRFVPLDEQYKDFKDKEADDVRVNLYEKSPLIDYLNAGMRYYSI